jgi:hypothetical protein
MRQSPLAQHARSAVWRSALFVFLVSSVTWLGAATVRAFIGNELLRADATTLSLAINSDLSPDAQREAFRLLSIGSTVVLSGYVLTLMSSIIVLLTSPFRMKQHGWLLMSAILFYLFVPVEIFTLVLDWKMIRLTFFENGTLEQYHAAFLQRVGALQGAPVIASLCYYTIIGLAVFQPFKKSSA